MSAPTPILAPIGPTPWAVGDPRDSIDPESVVLLTIDRARYAAASDFPSNWSLGAAGDHAVSDYTGFPAQASPDIDRIDRMGTEDVTTSPVDTRDPNTYFVGRLVTAGQVSITARLSAFDSAEQAAGIGTITAANADGAFDGIPDETDLTGTTATLELGRRGAFYSTYQAAATARIRRIDIDLDQARLEFDDLATLYDNPFPSANYAGTGGPEGPLALEDVRKPTVIGQVFNAPPVLVDPVLNTFQIHNGALAAITAVRYGGVPFIAGIDHPTFAALQAATIPIGEYQTCLAQGFLRAGLTAGPNGTGYQLTVDCRAASTATAEAVDVAEWIAGLVLLNHGAPVNAPAWAAMKAARTGYTYGQFLTQDVTYRALMNDACANANIYWGCDRSGQVTPSALASPDPLGPFTATYDENDILAIARLGMPDGFERPFRSRTLLYERNWAPTTSLAAIVNDPRLGEQWRTLTQNTTTPARNAFSPDEATTNLQTKAAAQQLATELLALHGRPRVMFSITVALIAGFPGFLSQVWISYPRFNLNSGRSMIVVGTTEDYDAGTATLTLWG